ncbi:putative retrotransposon protein [Cucumis melo var. makuwa]|uniref:Retrotransposon protein n=1 Tax=Cucumis melo var. makuwa TaxID=1194695 RepID=A0A5D3E2P1_CUCMM|nr:putative retrotransposon protein [Cucumis melo var. makuwa]TYK30383.1 putative retrotransposon protein [Cucumis melo var. makuwa]
MDEIGALEAIRGNRCLHNQWSTESNVSKARQKRFNTIKAFFNYKLAKNSLVSPHVLKIKSYLEQLKRLGLDISHKLAIKSFIELHGMLKTAALNIKSSFEVLMVQKGKNLKKRGHDQGKGNVKVAIKTSKVDAFVVPRLRPKPKEPKPPKEEECYHCKEIRH